MRVLYVVSYLISRITELVKITLEHVTARHSHAQQKQQHTPKHAATEATAPHTNTRTERGSTKRDDNLWQQKQNVPLGRSPARSLFTFVWFSAALPASALALLAVLAAPCDAEVHFCFSGAMSNTQKSALDS